MGGEGRGCGGIPLTELALARGNLLWATVMMRYNEETTRAIWLGPLVTILPSFKPLFLGGTPDPGSLRSNLVRLRLLHNYRKTGCNYV
jgi:hypothetical protein